MDGGWFLKKNWSRHRTLNLQQNMVSSIKKKYSITENLVLQVYVENLVLQVYIESPSGPRIKWI